MGVVLGMLRSEAPYHLTLKIWFESRKIYSFMHSMIFKLDLAESNPCQATINLNGIVAVDSIKDRFPLLIYFTPSPTQRFHVISALAACISVKPFLQHGDI